jgi:hypothetical protein
MNDTVHPLVSGLMVLLHGTCWHLRDRIERDGLVEPYRGRGVALCEPQDLAVAGIAMTTACTRFRHGHGGGELTGEGLLVIVDLDQLDDVVIAPAGMADAEIPTYLPICVRPQAIVELRRVRNVPLPARGSIIDTAMCSSLSGYAQDRPSWISERTRDVVVTRLDWGETTVLDRAAEKADAWLRSWGF